MALPRSLAAALLIALTASAHVTDTGKESADLLIRDVNLIDVEAGKAIPHQTIAVKDGRITAVLDDSKARHVRAANTLSGKGKYAIPGLWDMHVHFGGGDKLIEENRNLLPLYVAHGITAVRDAAGDLSPSVFQWRSQTADGSLLGPRIFTSGPKIEGIDSIWPGDLEIGSEVELDQALDKLDGWKVDFIKITDNTLPQDLFLSAVKKAKARGFRTSAHIPYGLTTNEASDAGLNSIEHIDYAFKAGSPLEKQVGEQLAAKKIDGTAAWEKWNASFDKNLALRHYRALAANGTALTPTLNGSQVVAYLDQDDHKRDEYLKYIGPGLQDTYAWRVERAAKDDAAAIKRRHDRFEKNAALLPLLQQAGVTLLAGTDAGFLNSYNYPGIGLHRELGLFVRYGLTPAQTLRAATINGARFLGQDKDYGTLQAGKRADIVLLDANPLQDIAATQRIDDVILGGKIYDRQALDAMLADVAERVRKQQQTRQP